MLLGVLRGDEPVAGVIRMPALGESLCRLPRRRRDEGRRADPLPQGRSTLEEARIFINEANRMLLNEPVRLARLMALGQIRRFFNDCYPFALLAMGQIDVVVDCDLQPYDYLPVVPVVEAAGGDHDRLAAARSSGSNRTAASSPRRRPSFTARS